MQLSPRHAYRRDTTSIQLGYPYDINTAWSPDTIFMQLSPTTFMQPAHAIPYRDAGWGGLHSGCRFLSPLSVIAFHTASKYLQRVKSDTDDSDTDEK